MSPGLRVCASFGLERKVKINKHGRYKLQPLGAKSSAVHIDFALSLTNVSEVLGVESYDDCIKHFEKNDSDFSVCPFRIHQMSDKFSVPVPAFSSSLEILSGYNEYTYQKEQQVLANNMPSVLANFAAYSYTIYSLASLFLFSLFLVVEANVLLVQRRLRVRRSIRKSIKYLSSFIRTGCKRWFLPSLVLNLGLFLLVTPFRILFKTNQVVIKGPQMITNYRKIIDQRVEIVNLGFGSNIDMFLQLGTKSHSDNSMTKIYKYFQSNSHRIRLAKSPKSLEVLSELSKAMVQGRQVIVSSGTMTEALRQLFCSWALEDDLYQILSFRDPIQGEVILGYAFRSLDPPKELVKRLRRAFEGHLPSTLAYLLNNYIGVIYLPNSPLHKQRQLFLCQQRILLPHSKEQVVPADLAFFFPFFATILVPIVLSFVLLWREVISRFRVFQKHQRASRCKTA